MEVATILEGKEKERIYGLMGNMNLTTNNNNFSIVTDYKFNGTVKEYLNSKKVQSSLKMVMLNDAYLDKRSSELSIGDLKKVTLAKALIENKDYLVLDYFDSELNYQEKEYFKRLWKRLENDYHKTVVIFTNDLTSFWDIAKELLYVDKYKVTNTIPKNEYDEFLDNLNKPEISQFTELIRRKGIDIEEYHDPKDLLKAIYRIKESNSWNI